MADPFQNASPSPAELERALREFADSLYAESRAPEWGLSPRHFLAALERSAAKRFAKGGFSTDGLGEYLGTLHIEDLCLASACLEGSEAAWAHFVSEYRGYLRAAAGVITKKSRGGTDALELADSLFAELFGLVDGRRGERSLFRYFHGRSSLKTWLRAILAQRQVDRLRQSRRWEQLEAEKEESPGHAPQPGNTPPIADPHRDRYIARFVAALHEAVDLLAPADRERLAPSRANSPAAALLDRGKTALPARAERSGNSTVLPIRRGGFTDRFSPSLS